jgi:hypothetical protein
MEKHSTNNPFVESVNFEFKHKYLDPSKSNSIVEHTVLEKFHTEA